MSSHHETLAKDVLSVFAVQEKASKEIGLYTVGDRPDQVLDWYFSQDPIQEDDIWAAMRFYETRDIGAVRDMLHRNTTAMRSNEWGAASLVSHALLPKELAGEGDYWKWKMDLLICTEPLAGIKDGKSTLSPDDVICYALLKAETRVFTHEEAENLFIAAEMLMAASSTKNTAAVLAPDSENAVSETRRRAADRLMSHKIMEKLLSPTFEISGDPVQARILKLQIGILRTSMAMADVYYKNPTERSKQFRDEILVGYMDTLRKEFTGPDRLQIAGNTGGSMKGVMHEAVWLLDAMMLREGERQKYNVFPSLLRQDRPRINRPALNRGFDFMLTSPDNEQAFQLKSSKKSLSKEYHPLIKVLSEQNFMDIDERRLASKLKAYKQAIDSDFSGSAWQQAKKYILPTAQEALEIFNRPRADHQSYLAELALTYGFTLTPPPNRAQRRQAARKKRNR